MIAGSCRNLPGSPLVQGQSRVGPLRPDNGGLMLALFLIPALIIPGLQVPEPEREKAEQLPPRLAKLVQPPKPVEPPEPVVEPEPEQSKPEPEPKRVEAPQQIPPEPTVAKSKPEPELAPQTTEQARETASRSGLFA